VNIAQHPAPADVRPVRISAGAFADGRPVRDLCLSPEHAVFVEGVLVPVKFLVNGTTVVQERPETVTYWHVEVPSHDILLAEDLPVESFLDTGNRDVFESGGTVIHLHASFARIAAGAWAQDACAPLVEDGPVLTAVRAQLDARAAAQNQSVPTVLEIDLSPGYTRAIVPAAVDTIRLVSPSGHLADDHRRLQSSPSAPLPAIASLS